jgi:ankyrin repeat protein
LYTFSEDLGSVSGAISVRNDDDQKKDGEVFPSGKTNLFHIAARMGLVSLFESLFQDILGNEASKLPEQKPQKSRQSQKTQSSTVGGFEFNREDDYGYTILYLAVVGGHKHLVKRIIDDKRFTDKPLGFQTRLSVPTVMERLGRDPIIKSPLMIALREKHGAVAHILLKDGRFDPTELYCSYGVIHSLVFNGAHAVNQLPRLASNAAIPLRVLRGVAQGSTGSPECPTSQQEPAQEQGFLERKMVPIVEFLSKDPDEAMGTLSDDIKGGSDLVPPGTDSKIGNALHVMAAHGSLEMIQVLLNCSKLDIDATNPFNHTALAFAASENHSDVVDYLLAKNAKVYIRSHYRDSPLFLALDKCHEGGDKVVKSLLRKGMEPVPKKSAFLALHLAAAVLSMEEGLVQKCMEKEPRLLRPLKEGLRGKTWPKDWPESRRLLYEYVRSYEGEWTKAKTEGAVNWIKERTSRQK